MAEITADTAAKQSVHTSFFFWMTVGMAVLIFGGFSLTYFIPMAVGDPLPVGPLVHAHGFFYFSWMALLVVQSALINQQNVAMHRSLGMLGISIGTGLLIFGTLATIVFTKRLMVDSDPTIYGLMYISELAVFGFAILFVMAIRNIRDGAAHKRYILLATTTFLIGGVKSGTRLVSLCGPHEAPRGRRAPSSIRTRSLVVRSITGRRDRDRACVFGGHAARILDRT